MADEMYRPGVARRRCIDLMADATEALPPTGALVSPDARALALAILALAEAVTDASRHVTDTIDQAANSLDATIHSAASQITTQTSQ